MSSRKKRAVAPATGDTCHLKARETPADDAEISSITPVAYSHFLRTLASPAELQGGQDEAVSTSDSTAEKESVLKQLVLPAILFFVLASTCLTAFFAIRSAEVGSRRDEAAASMVFAEGRLVSALDTLRRDLAGLRTTTSIAMTTARNESLHWHSHARFLEAQRELTNQLQQIETASPFIFGAAVIPHIPASDIHHTQLWGEEMLGFAPGTLALTQPSPDARTPPPDKPRYWVLAFHNDLPARGTSSYLLDVEEAEGRKELFNKTIRTGDIVSTPPTLLGSLNNDGIRQQILYQAVPSCPSNGLPARPCGFAGNESAVAINVVAFQHQSLLDHSLSTEPYTGQIAVRIQVAGETVALHRWSDPSHGLHEVERKVVAFDGVSWTVEFRSTRTLLSGTANALSVILLLIGLLVSAILSFSVLAFIRSLASAAQTRFKYSKDALKLQLSARRDALFDFLRTTSHDLRTPLHAISMSVEELRAEHPDAYNTAPIRIVKLNTQLLGGMISNVLDMDNISKGKLDLLQDSCDLSKVFSELIEMMHVVARDKNITLTYEAPPSPLPFVVCDKMRILRCVQNVIGNAVKFTRQGGITLKVWSGSSEEGTQSLPDLGKSLWTPEHASLSQIAIGSDRSPVEPDPRFTGPLRIWQHPEFSGSANTPSNTCVHVSVSDTGAGMEECKLDECVVPFKKAEAKHNGGSGLGLHVVLGVCLAYRGRLSLMSRVNEGTQFVMSFVMPTTTEDPDPDSEDQSTSAASTATAGAARLEVGRPSRPAASARESFMAIPAPNKVPGLFAPLRSAASARLSPLNSRPLTSPSPVTVVVVDDQVTNAKLLQRQVMRLVDTEKVTVKACFDGAQVFEMYLESLSAEEPRLDRVVAIFMDYSMPVMDGVEATIKIREAAKAHNLKPYIVMLTANATTADKEQATDAGCDAFQPKPCSVPAVKSHLLRAGLTKPQP